MDGQPTTHYDKYFVEQLVKKQNARLLCDEANVTSTLGTLNGKKAFYRVYANVRRRYNKK